MDISKFLTFAWSIYKQSLRKSPFDVIGFYQVVTLTSPTGVYPYGQSPRIGGVKVVRALSITGITDITVSDSGECNTYLQKP